MNLEFDDAVKKILTEEQIERQESLAKHTTFRIGGPAEYFLKPKSEEEIARIIACCKEQNVPYYVLGNGSNVLAEDEGYAGVILHVGKNFSSMEIKKNSDGSFLVCAGAGMMLSKLAKEAAKEGLTGLEFAAGIPGMLGGAITMNAGAYGGEIKDCIQWAKVVTPEGESKVLTKEQLELGYRSSVIQREGYIVTQAEFLLFKGGQETIYATMEEYQNRRKEKQPLEYPSAGSTFKRPEGYFAGKLIEDAGLRGYRVGDLMVSEKHCGFVVNVGEGTAKDAHQLLEDVSRIVYEKFQVTLEPEVRFLK